MTTHVRQFEHYILESRTMDEHSIPTLLAAEERVELAATDSNTGACILAWGVEFGSTGPLQSYMYVKFARECSRIRPLPV